MEMYQGFIQNHFATIDHVRINQITVSTIEKFVSDKQANGVHLGTLRKIITTANQILQYSVRHKYIDHNPVRDVERPRDRGEVEKPHIRVLSPSEIGALLDATERMKYHTLCMLAVMSGAREGELLGLKWSDIDWENNQIHIQRTFNHRRWFKPKSKASIRRIDLGNTMMTELKRWKLACPPNGLELLFPSEDGTPIDHCNLLHRVFHPALKKAGLPHVRFHDLRHTYASLMIEQGENIKYIQTQLGHSTPMMTLNVYSHLMSSCNQSAPSRLEKTIFEGTGSKMVAENENGTTAVSVTP